MPNINLDILLSGGSEVIAEVAKIDQSIDGIGKSGKRSGSEMAAGFSGAEKAARDSARAVATAGQAAASYSNEIRDSRAELARMGSQLREAVNGFGAKSAAATNLKTKMADLAANIRQMVAEQAILVAESKVEQQAVEASTNAFSRKTNMINTGGGALRGWDAALQAGIRSVGGITVGFSILLSASAALLPALLNLGKAKKELVKLDEEQIALNVLIARFSSDQKQVVAAQAASIGQLSIAFEQSIKAATDLTASTAKLIEAQRAMREDVGKTTATYHSLGQGSLTLKKSVEELRGELNAASTTQSTNTKTFADASAPLLAYANTTRLSTAGVLELGKQLDYTEEKLVTLAAQLESDSVKLAKFASQAARASQEMRTLTEAQIAYDIARASAKSPDFQGRTTLQDFKAFAGEIDQNFAVLLNSGASFREATINQMGPLRALRQHLQEATGSVAEYNKVLSDTPWTIRRGLTELDNITKGMKAFAQDTKKNTFDMSALEKEAALSGIKFQMEGLAEKEALIKKEFEFRREALRNAKLSQAEYALAISLLGQIELRQLTEVTKEKIALYGTEQVERARLIEQGHETRRRLENQEIREQREANARRAAEERKFFDALEDERLKRDKRILDSFVKAIKKSEDAVHKFFGFIGRDNRTFQLQLRALERFGKRDIFGGLIDSLRVLGSELINGGVLAQSFGDSIENAFARALGSGESFLRSFAASLIAGLTQIVAQMLSQIGTQLIAKGTADILMGIALNANPLTPGAGTALIAAGKAELAQGLILKAAAGIISGLGQLASNAVAGKGSSGAAGGGGSSAAGGGQSKLSPGPEFSGSARVAEIDRRIARLDFLADRAWGVFERAFRRQIELLEAERRALLGATSAAREPSRALRVAVNSADDGVRPSFGLPSGQVVLIEQPVYLDHDATKEWLDGAFNGRMEKNRTLTAGNIGSRYRRHVKKKLK